MEELDKTTGLKKAYAEIILNTAKESAARVMVSDRKSARFHEDLSETKGEALRLLIRLKHMIEAKTIEAEVISANQQRQIDVLEAQLHEAEDIITDLRSQVSWVRDRLEKAKSFEFQELNLVNKEEEEEEMVSDQKVDPEVVLESLNPNQDDPRECESLEKAKASELQERNLEEETVSVVESLVPDQEVADTCFVAKKTLDVECEENDEKHFDGFSVVNTLQAYESQERNVVNLEEEEETVVSVHDVILESVNPDQEDHSSLHDVECEENDENLEKLKASEFQEQNLVNKEEEMVSVHKVYPEVVTESSNPDQEDLSSLDDVKCENLEKAKASESQERNLVNMEEEEEEIVSADKVDQEVVVECLKPDEEVADTCKIDDAECENDEKHFDRLSVVDTPMGNNVCESESDGAIRIKKLELSRNGCTQRIHALERVVLERKSSSSADEEEQEGTTEKESEQNLSSGKTRCLVLALRASSAEVVTLPSNTLGIKKTSKRRRKTRFGKPKAKSVRTQSHQLIKPCCQSQSNVTCSKASASDGEDSIETHLSVESKEVLVDVLVSCEDSVVPSTKVASSLVNLHSESKVTAVVSDQISESPPRANVNRVLKYTFHRKRKRGTANINLPRKRQESEARDQIESILK